MLGIKTQQEHKLCRTSQKGKQSLSSAYHVYSVNLDTIFILICEVYHAIKRKKCMIDNLCVC